MIGVAVQAHSRKGDDLGVAPNGIELQPDVGNVYLLWACRSRCFSFMSLVSCRKRAFRGRARPLKPTSTSSL